MTQKILHLSQEGFCEYCGSAFSGSAWNLRYAQGGTSGAGSYGKLGQYKAAVIDEFILAHSIQSVVDFGCGDGYQISLIRNLPNYLGLDVSPVALYKCKQRFITDPSKSFYLYDSISFDDKANLFKAELALSLDVIYHLIDRNLFQSYLDNLFNSASRFVMIYSSDFDSPYNLYEQRRSFTGWVTVHFPKWELTTKIDNVYPYEDDNPDDTSYSDWFIYSKTGEAK